MLNFRSRFGQALPSKLLAPRSFCLPSVLKKHRLRRRCTAWIPTVPTSWIWTSLALTKWTMLARSALLCCVWHANVELILMPLAKRQSREGERLQMSNSFRSLQGGKGGAVAVIAALWCNCLRGATTWHVVAHITFAMPVAPNGKKMVSACATVTCGLKPIWSKKKSAKFRSLSKCIEGLYVNLSGNRSANGWRQGNASIAIGGSRILAFMAWTRNAPIVAFACATTATNAGDVRTWCATHASCIGSKSQVKCILCWRLPWKAEPFFQENRKSDVSHTFGQEGLTNDWCFGIHFGGPKFLRCFVDPEWTWRVWLVHRTIRSPLEFGKKRSGFLDYVRWFPPESNIAPENQWFENKLCYFQGLSLFQEG